MGIKLIPGFGGKYGVNKEGDVFTFIERSPIGKNNYQLGNNPKPLRQRIDEEGYYKVTLEHKTHMVHRLIMMTFKPIHNPQNFHVDHKNNIRHDNRLCNLQWLTPRQNVTKKPPIKGEKNPKSKLTNKDVFLIRAQAPSQTYATLSKLFGVSRHTIADIVQGISWRHLLPLEGNMKKTKKTKKTKKGSK